MARRWRLGAMGCGREPRARVYIYVYGISKSRHLRCKAHRFLLFLSAVRKRVFYPVLGDFGVRGMLKSGLENQNEQHVLPKVIKNAPKYSPCIN